MTEPDVRDLIHGCLFTRGPKDLHNTAVWIGGTNMAAGEQLLALAVDSMFPPFKVSIMLDSNGSNTTAVAAVAKLQQAAGNMQDRRAMITAGTGPVGLRAAGLLAQAGADVAVTSRSPHAGIQAVDAIRQRFGTTVRAVTMSDRSHAAARLEGAELLLNTGLAGVCLVPRDAWVGRAGLRVAADLNAVPPLGVEGIEVHDDGVVRDGVKVFGALAVGKLKMKIHKACITRLFGHNDLVLDAETIAEIARDLLMPRG